MCRIPAQTTSLPAESPSPEASADPCQKCDGCRVRDLIEQHVRTTAPKRTPKSNRSQNKS